MFIWCIWYPQIFGEEMLVQMYAPPVSKIDPSIFVILLIAIVTVSLGGCWSGACERCGLCTVLETSNLWWENYTEMPLIFYLTESGCKVVAVVQEVERTRETVEICFSTLLWKWSSLWPWCVGCWCSCTSFTVSLVSGNNNSTAVLECLKGWCFIMFVFSSFVFISTVYVIIAIFCMASASALFSCFDAVLDKLGCGTVKYEWLSFSETSDTKQ